MSLVKYGHLLIWGDFNSRLSDFTSSAKGWPLSLRSLHHAEQVHDVWWCQHAAEKDYMYYSSRHGSHSHIELFVANLWLLQRTSSSSIKDVTWSYHTAILLTLGAQISMAQTWYGNVALQCQESVGSPKCPGYFSTPPGVLPNQYWISIRPMGHLECPQSLHEGHMCTKEL